MRRTAIYAIQANHTQMDGYAVYFLRALSEYAQQILIVGTPVPADLPAACRWINAVCPTVEAAYQAGLDALSEPCEEIIFASDSIMGPVYPLEEMFTAMEKSDAALWGAVLQHAPKRFPETSFLVLRTAQIPEGFSVQDILSLPPERTAAYAEMNGRAGFADRPMLRYAEEALRLHRCPFFLREVFVQDYAETLHATCGQAASELIEFIRMHTAYDAGLIFQHILRTGHQADIVKNLHLNYVLPDSVPPVPGICEKLSGRHILLVMHLYCEELFQKMHDYARAMPPHAHIILTTTDERRRGKIAAVFADFPQDRLEIRVLENRGRDVASIMVGVKDVLMDYDYACYVHDKKSTHFSPYSIGEAFAKKCLDNVLFSREYVLNLLALFEENPHIGLLFPPEPDAGPYYATFGSEWGPNFGCTKALARQLGITVPLSIEKEPVAPMGSFYWFRPCAMRCLYAPDWTYADFPAEPVATDGTLLHAIERIRPYAVQQEGYCPAYVLSASYARLEFTNLHHYCRELTAPVVQSGVACSAFGEIQAFLAALVRSATNQPGTDATLRRQLRRAKYSPRALRLRLKRLLPKKAYTAMIRFKRRLFGPHGVEFHYEDQ